MKSVNDELIEQTEGIRRENKNLTQEIKDLTDQLTEGGRSVHELQKMVRRLELEKEELQVRPLLPLFLFYLFISSFWRI